MLCRANKSEDKALVVARGGVLSNCGLFKLLPRTPPWRGQVYVFFSPPCLKLFLIKDRWQLQCLLCQILIAEAFHPRAVHARHNLHLCCQKKQDNVSFARC